MIDLALHAAVGAFFAFIGISSGFGPIATTAAVLAFGVARESWQRDWKAPWNFSAHAWQEAGAWGVGAGVVAVGMLK